MGTSNFTIDPLDEMEDVLGVFYGGRGQVGSQFVITNRRLLIGPLNVKVATDIDAYVLDKAAPGAGSVLKSVLSDYAPMNPKTLWLRHVVSVRATHKASLLRAPGLELRTDTNETIQLGIVVATTTMNRNPGNNVARDQMVALLTQAIASAKAAPPSPV